MLSELNNQAFQAGKYCFKHLLFMWKFGCKLSTMIILLLFGLFAFVNSLELVVLHTNDMHARLEPISGGGGACTETSPRCFGGFARVKAYADLIRKNNKNVVFLNAGDNYQGTPYYSMYKWRVMVPFVDSIGIDVMSLGNHEFDDGVDGLAPYLETVKTPSVCANIDYTKEPALEGTNLHPWRYVNVDGVKIAVIGYLTPDTKFLSRTGKVELMDEVTSLKRAVQEVKDNGAQLVFVVGHSGFDIDCKIAAEVEGVDLVVGGHTDTFLYTGVAPEKEVPASLYPHVVEQASGKKVPVVQAYGYTKYVGFLKMIFDQNLKLVSAMGNPVLMDSSVPQDEEVLKLTEYWKKNLTANLKDPIGETYVDLSADGCRRMECNMGNLVADAFLAYAAKIARDKNLGWTDTPVAYINAGTLRASINRNDTQGIITRGDVLTVMPFNNELIKITVNASTIKVMLEKGVENYDKSGIILHGGFPQVSGIHVLYDIDKSPGNRVVNFKVRCSRCSIPFYYEPERDEKITLITNSFLAGGGDGYDMLIDHPNKEFLSEETDFTAFQDFVKRRSPITVGIEERVRFVKNPHFYYSEVGKNRQDEYPMSSSTQLTNNLIATILVSIYTFFRHF